jgi:hypothetical protein
MNLDTDKLLASGAIEGPFKRTRPLFVGIYRLANLWFRFWPAK